MFDRPKPSEIPTKPGAYMFRDAHGRVIYAGKAKNLRSRGMSYFGAGLHPRTQAVIGNARHFEWIVPYPYVDALMLEYNLIKKLRRRFNVKLVDDESYSYLVITRTNECPQALVTRARNRKGTQY